MGARSLYRTVRCGLWVRVAGTFVGILLGAALVVVAVTVAAQRFTWNLTPSLPRGLYILRPNASARRAAIVIFAVPKSVRPLVATRHYLPPGTRLLKRIVALPGDRVCVAGSAVFIDGRVFAAVLISDSRGRHLEPVSFCGPVPPGEAFVATPTPLSFDSRYFGPIPLAALTVVQPVWTF
jgi:conjugative transfer signal peptidase TraF